MITIGKWILGGMLMLIAVSVGVVLAPLAFLALAFVVSDPRLLALAGATVGGLVVGGLTFLLGWWLARRYRRRLSLVLGIATSLVLLVAAAVFLFQPRAFGQRTPVDQTGVNFASLATGSRLAYRVLPSVAAVRRGGIIFVHGGPGAEAVANDPFITALSPFTDAGFDVCLYDQIGSGSSARLDDPEDYTVARQVDDLEALRGHLGWARPVLIGESWGTQLIARYASDFPDNVTAAVLVSPGPLRPLDWADRDTGGIKDRLTDTDDEAFNGVLDARFVTAMLLLRINPRAAFRFLPQVEAERYGSAILAVLAPGGVCDPDVLRGHSATAVNLWVALMTRHSLQEESAGRLDGLAATSFSVLVLRGECEYGHEDIAAEYLDAFPHSELVAVAGAGHFLLLEKPRDFQQAVERFLDIAEVSVNRR